MTKRIMDARTGLSIEDGRFFAAMNEALRRGDGRDDSFQRYRMEHNRARFAAARADAANRGRRTDSFGSDGFYTEREVEAISARVMQEKYPIQSSFMLFPRWPEAPVGAKKMTIYRESEQGEAVIHRGGKNIPVVGATKDEESFRMVPVVTSREQDIFDRMTDVFAGGRKEAAKKRAARRAIMERVNQINWFGDEASGIHGVLTYPYLPKVESSVVISALTSDDAIIAEINRIANWPSERSREVFSPNACVTSKRLKNRLSQRKYDDTGKSLLDWIIGNNEAIPSVQTAPELKEPFGDANVDAMLFYRNDPDSVALNLPYGIEDLPVQREGFDDKVYTFTIAGGAIMIDTGDSVLVLFEIQD